VQQRAAHVEVLAAAAVQNEECGDVGCQAPDCHSEHGAAQHWNRIGKPPHCLDEDPRGNGEQGQPIDEGGENLVAPIAV
jgi:hypothetical protein